MVDGSRCEMPSSWSQSATLLVQPRALSAEPIWAGGARARYALLRREVVVESGTKVKSAVAFVAAAQSGPMEKLLGSYRLYVGGRAMGIGPGRGEVRTASYAGGGDVNHTMYDSIDVTNATAEAAVASGVAVLGLQCYHPTGDESAGVILELHIQLSNGTTATVSTSSTDRAWRTFDATEAFGPTAQTGQYKAPQEWISSGKMPGGWTLAGFHPPEAPAAAAWVQPSSRNASSLSLSSAHLRPKPTLALALQEAVKPATFSQVGPGAWFADFGHEVMGGLSLRVNLVAFPPGSRLQLTLGEELVGDPKNSTTILYPMRTGNTYRHVWTVGRHSAGGGEAAGSGGEVGGVGGGASQASFENHEYMVFRYASILVLGHGTSHPLKGAAGSAATDELTLTAWTVSYPWVEDESSFSSSMPELDQVWRLARDTLRVTSLDTTTDSNTRERLPYEADGYITGLSRLALQSDVQWPRHSSRHNIVNPTWPTEWRQTVSLLALIDWMHVGGPEPALYAEFGAAMVEQTQAACIEPTTGLVDFKSCARRTGGFGAGSEARLRDIVDWPEAARDGYNLTNVNTVVNAYTAGGLRALAELADASGDAAGANALRQKASRVTNAINARLFDPKAGLYVDGADDSGAPIEHTSWHASVFPAAFGLVPRERWPSLLSMFDRRGMVGSVYAAFWFLRALYALESDGGQLALQVLTSCAKNSWCNMIAQGATATMEAWTPDEKPNLSWSHPWASAPASAVAWGLMGIRPTKPAFEELIVRPQPGNLSSAKIKVPTRRGPVIAQIRQEFARGPSVPQQRGATPMTFTLTLSVPVTSSATVCLPRLGSASPDILLDGKRIRGVLEDDFVCVAQIGSSAEPHVLVRQA